MKKVLAVMLAAATTMSIGVTAFANDEIGNGTAVVSSYADLLLDSGNPDSSSSAVSYTHLEVYKRQCQGICGD